MLPMVKVNGKYVQLQDFLFRKAATADLDSLRNDVLALEKRIPELFEGPMCPGDCVCDCVKVCRLLNPKDSLRIAIDNTPSSCYSGE